jgi:lysophospholipase L1-like esterase
MTSVDAPSFTVTDWVKEYSRPRIDGGAQPLLWIRIMFPGANANVPAQYQSPSITTTWEQESSCAGRLYRMRGQAVDGVNTISAFTTGSTANYFGAPVIIQYLSRKTGITVLVIGDSIDEGVGATDRLGWQHIAKHVASSVNAPIEVCTQAIGGANSATWLARLNLILNTVNPDYVMYPGYEVNDQATPMAAFGINTSRFNAHQARKAATDVNAVPIVRTGIPSDTAQKAFTATDSLRVGLNGVLRSNATSQLVFDADAVMAGVTTGGQVQLAAAYDADGIHPNDAGHQALADQKVIPLFRQIISVNQLA